MRERPILFNAEMVRAILDGRKTMTRRVVKPQPEDVFVPEEGFVACDGEGIVWGRQRCQCGYDSYDVNGYPFPTMQNPICCPCGIPGDFLWLREAWYCDDPAQAQDLINPGLGLYYRATEIHPEIFKWKPSIFMPRWASRITLEITDIRVERSQEITEEDAKAEGVERFPVQPGNSSPYVRPFADLWDSINGKKYPWESNPFVWVIEFKVVA